LKLVAVQQRIYERNLVATPPDNDTDTKPNGGTDEDALQKLRHGSSWVVVDQYVWVL